MENVKENYEKMCCYEEMLVFKFGSNLKLKTDSGHIFLCCFIKSWSHLPETPIVLFGFIWFSFDCNTTWNTSLLHWLRGCGAARLRKRNGQPPSIPVCHSEKEKCRRYSARRPLPHPDKSPSSWSLGSGGRMQPLPTSPAAPAFRLFLPVPPKWKPGLSPRVWLFLRRPLSATRLPWWLRTRTEKAKTGLRVPVARKFWRGGESGGRIRGVKRLKSPSAEVGSYKEQIHCYCTWGKFSCARIFFIYDGFHPMYTNTFSYFMQRKNMLTNS